MDERTKRWKVGQRDRRKDKEMKRRNGKGQRSGRKEGRKDKEMEE